MVSGTKSINDRIEWIDISKGIGIILVVLGHIWITGNGQKYINSFHMPLFFLLSGYIFNPSKFENIRKMVSSKFDSIIIPYLFFSLITYAYWFVIERRISGNPISPISAFINIFTSQGADNYLPHNPALWFLPCLFVVEIMFYLIAKNMKPVSISIVLLIFSISGYIVSQYVPSYLPWSIDVALTGIVFYGTGFLIRNIKNTPKVSNSIMPVILCICLPAGFIISSINTQVGMALNIYGNYFLFYAAAFLSIAGTVAISKLLRNFRPLSYLGKNSIIIFGLHFPVKRLVMAVTSKVLNIPMEQLRGSLLLGIADTTITILILLPVILFIHKYCTFILGKRNVHKESVHKRTSAGKRPYVIKL